MRTERLEIHPHYSIGFMCRVCGQEGRYNWEAKDGEIFKCDRCGTEHKVIFKLEIRTRNTKRHYLNKNLISLKVSIQQPAPPV
jgi:hypothetical protein